jgi:uncharacterized membrane protein
LNDDVCARAASLLLDCIAPVLLHLAASLLGCSYTDSTRLVVLLPLVVVVVVVVVLKKMYNSEHSH